MLYGNRLVIAIDFDGTIAEYDIFRGHDHYGEPLDGVKDALDKLHDHTLIVNTCRADVAGIYKYMVEHELLCSYVNFSPRSIGQKLSFAKIAADIYIDDKAICFKGNWAQTLDEIKKFKVWYK